jgi:hypothetical protein
MNRTRTILQVAAGILVLAGTPLAAQPDERSDAQVRNDCRLAAQVIRTGDPAPHREWAFDIITRCSQSGPGIIAETWQRPPADEVTLRMLIAATTRLRTRQVFESVGSAARNPQNSALVRTYALSMLYSFAWPGGSIHVQDLLHPRENRSARVYRASGDGSIANAPDLGDVKDEVRTVLAEIVATDREDSIVRAAQEVLSKV